jgi:hypothetical protein
MAQLELANLAPAAGAAAKVIGVGTTVEADGGAAVAKSFSFSRLLQADASGESRCGGFRWTRDRALGRVVGHRIRQRRNPVWKLVDPADLGKAGEQLMVAALTAGLSPGSGSRANRKSRRNRRPRPDRQRFGHRDRTDASRSGLARPAVVHGCAGSACGMPVLRSAATSSESTEAVDAARLRLIRCVRTPALGSGGGWRPWAGAADRRANI